MDKVTIQIWGYGLLQPHGAVVPAVRCKPRLQRGLFAAIRQPFSRFALLSLWVGLSLVHRAVAQVTDVGAIVSFANTANGIAGKTERASFKVMVYNEHTIRVIVSQNPSPNLLEYALVNNQLPDYKNFTIRQQANQIIIATNSLDVYIERSPSFRIIFYNKQGRIINEDAAGKGFGTSFLGANASLYKMMQPGERFVALGEVLGNLDKRGTGVLLNNTDTYKYGDPRLSMYISIPFYIGIHQQMQYGMFSNNSYPTFFNFGLSTPQYASINMGGGAVDYFLMYDESIAKILAHYTALTGRMPLPPKWAIGYQQSRCSYMSAQEVAWIGQSFRQKQIPIDGIVLDADYQQDYRPFVTNKMRFPNLPELAKTLAQKNIALTASVYPGIAIDSSYRAYQTGLKEDVFIKYASGQNFQTEIAPVQCYLPDYTNPHTRAWWKSNMKWMVENNIKGYWNDMNEPAVGGSYLPNNLVFDFEGRKASALEAKNIYGFQMARSSYEAAMENVSNTRPFVLTRSAFAGVQRYAAVWSGDNTATDEGLMSSILLNNQMGLSGIAFCGHDIGGFIGDGSKELYIRWIQAGIFSPYCRNHKGCGGPAGEPWAYGAEAEAISKNYIGFRYQLMPYLYSAFYQATQTGMPIAQSLCISYPHDARVYDPAFQYQFFFGNDMLVAPVTSKELTKAVYLPEGDWYHLYADTLVKGGTIQQVNAPIHQLPVFVKASAIIPMQSLVQSANERPADTLFLHFYYGSQSNTFDYYEDDGQSLQYQQNDFYKRQVIFNPSNRTITFGKASGNFASQFNTVTCILHGFPNNIQTFEIAAQKIKPATMKHAMFNSLQWLEQVYEPGYFAAEASKVKLNQMQQVISFSINANETMLRW